MHPTACTQALSQFTQTEINTLAQVLTDMGRSAEEASTLSCLAFNTLYGSQMFGTKDSKSIKILRETGCRLLGVAVDSDPRTPPLPWAEDDQSDRR
ncbi:MAG: hypothetical protein IBX64_05715 [Actinobacteria bacterium]|nr:hypothetical protein [Actinomycetota bacterium]